MPKLQITGLAQETDFAEPQKTRTVLVIDNGGLRIPLDENAVEQILIYAINGSSKSPDKEETTPVSNGHAEPDPEPEETDVEDEDDNASWVTDEAGISQI